MMNKFSKKSAFGVTTVAAAAALVAGFAAPAMASTGHSGSTDHASKWSSSNRQTTDTTSAVTRGQLDALRDVSTGVGDGSSASNWSPVTVSPTVGDVGSGDAIGSGNDVPLLSGNTVSVPVLSGNTTAVGNNDGNGSISTDVNNLVSDALNGNSATNSSSASASDIVGSITSDLGLSNLGGR
ncbi:MAG TPA: hypothetical protein VHZ81_12605 [Galbitalea sp.]|jgi:hypothetical protein|nr:hypothetical protein [Galbitalea sp.]